MSGFKQNFAVLLLIIFSLFHLGIAQRLFVAVPQGGSACCAYSCGCPPMSCTCEHDEDAGASRIVFEAPECSMIKTTINGAFALMFFLPAYLQTWEEAPKLLSYSLLAIDIPDSDFTFPLERPPRLS